MKTQKTIKAVMLFVAIFVLTLSTIEAKSRFSHPLKKEKSHHKMVEIYFEVQQPSSSNIFVITGRGSATSGTLSGYEIGCVNEVIDASGTATGTYSYNSSTGVMSLNGTVTPYGQSAFTVFGSPIQFSSSQISINCGYNNQP